MASRGYKRAKVTVKAAATAIRNAPGNFKKAAKHVYTVVQKLPAMVKDRVAQLAEMRNQVGPTLCILFQPRQPCDCIKASRLPACE